MSRRINRNKKQDRITSIKDTSLDCSDNKNIQRTKGGFIDPAVPNTQPQQIFLDFIVKIKEKLNKYTRKDLINRRTY